MASIGAKAAHRARYWFGAAESGRIEQVAESDDDDEATAPAPVLARGSFHEPKFDAGWALLSSEQASELSELGELLRQSDLLLWAFA